MVRRFASMVKKLDSIDNFPVLSKGYFALLHSIDRSPSVDRTAEIIGHDLGLTVNILRYVNSAFFQVFCNRKIVSIKDAIVRLGYLELKKLVISFKVISAFKECGGRQIWEHGLIVADLFARIVQMTGLEREMKRPIDDFYTIGLIHDLGIIVLECYFSDLYHKVKQDNENLTGDPLHRREREILGTSHQEIAGYLARRFRLDDLVIDLLENHHCCEEYDGPYRTALVLLGNIDILAYVHSHHPNEDAPEVISIPGIPTISLGIFLEELERSNEILRLVA